MSVRLRRSLKYALALLICDGVASVQLNAQEIRSWREETPVSYAQDQAVPATDDRLAALEAELQSIKDKLQEEKDKKAAADAEKAMEESKPYVIGSDPNMPAKWTNDGATLQSKHKDFKFKMRGLAQFDGIAIENNPGGGSIAVPGGAGTKDSATFRRLRLGAEGTMYDQIDWVFEMDFALALQNLDPGTAAAPATGLRSLGGFNQAGNTAGVIQPSTIFMTFKEVPLFQNVRIGNQQDWISLDHIESARFLDFMERAPIMDAFNGANNNGYTPGISSFANTESKRMGLQLGVYKNNVYDSGFPYDVGDNNYTFNGRIIGTPYYDESSKGEYLFHTGFGTEVRTFDNNPAASQAGTNVRLRSRGDLRNTSSTLCPNFADTGNFYASNQVLLCPEMAMVAGPWLLQAEYEASYMNGAAVQKGGQSLGQAFFSGGYAEALYFLTGEHRDYNQQTGVFGRVVPKHNALWRKGCSGGGIGAWQLGVRYDWLNLNSGLINGGQNNNLTTGLNWFLNPNARLQFNYVLSKIDNGVATTFPGTVGSLNGSRYVGNDYVNSFGTRLDFNF